MLATVTIIEYSQELRCLLECAWLITGIRIAAMLRRDLSFRFNIAKSCYLCFVGVIASSARPMLAIDSNGAASGRPIG